MRHATEAENIAVNSAIVRHVLDAVGPSGSVRHTALVTGLKHYIGPFEAYATGTVRGTPFHEDEPRLKIPNFYYAQVDELVRGAERYGFGWSEHRSHTIIGHTVGNAMNLGQTLAAQAALCREEGTPFVFPGNEVQWNGLTDMTDAGLLARQMVWAATTPGLGRRLAAVGRTEAAGRTGPRPRRIVVAHRRRPEPPRRVLHRHEPQPHRRFCRLRRHPPVVRDPVRHAACEACDPELTP